jgi:hypothetical protein
MLLAFDIAVYAVALFMLVVKLRGDEPVALNLRH